jgi:hypothetical protein
VGNLVIAVYRPKPGKDTELLALTKDHVPKLRRLGLATDRPALAGIAADGSVVEMFEWHDGAAEAAHQHPEVLAMWAEYGDVCDYTTLSTLPEASTMFPSFKPIDL